MPRIIYIGDEIIAIDKPAGMPAVSLGEGEEDTLAAWIIRKFPEQKGLPKGALEAGLIHRLDNDTSGIIIAARNPGAYNNLRAQFDEESVKKEYVALVVGVPPKNGTIEFPIANHPRKKKKMIACRSEKEARELHARNATTSFHLIKAFRHPKKKTAYSLLSVSIKSGARHQIRVHLAALGFPLAGDALYQNPKIKNLDSLGLSRHFLHASKIEFRHPATNERILFESGLPLELDEILVRS